MANPCSLQVFELLWTKHQNPSSHAFGTHDICVWHQAPKWRTPLLERCTSSKYSQILALPVRGQKEATQIYWGLLIKMLQFSLKKSQQFFWVHLDCTCNVGIEDSFRNNSVEIINSIQLGKTERCVETTPSISLTMSIIEIPGQPFGFTTPHGHDWTVSRSFSVHSSKWSILLVYLVSPYTVVIQNSGILNDHRGYPQDTQK